MIAEKNSTTQSGVGASGATGTGTTGKAARSLHVLVADDHPVNLRLVAEILRERGHRTTLADTGFDALRMFRNGSFDAILMDGQMPEMDGYAVTREIRRIERFCDVRIPIIAVTANSGIAERQNCLDAGMDDYITKPIDPDVLLDCLESTFAGAVRLSVANPARRSGAASPAASLPTFPTSDLPVFNRADAFERVRGKHSFLRQLTDMFLAELPKVLDAVASNAAAGNLAQLETLAHRLRGAAVTVGGEAMAAVAAALEQAAGSGSVKDVPALVAQLNQSAGQLRSVLEDFATEATPPPAERRRADSGRAG